MHCYLEKKPMIICLWNFFLRLNMHVSQLSTSTHNNHHRLLYRFYPHCNDSFFSKHWSSPSHCSMDRILVLVIHHHSVSCLVARWRKVSLTLHLRMCDRFTSVNYEASSLIIGMDIYCWLKSATLLYWRRVVVWSQLVKRYKYSTVFVTLEQPIRTKSSICGSSTIMLLLLIQY